MRANRFIDENVAMSLPRYEAIRVSPEWTNDKLHAKIVFRKDIYRDFFYDIRDNPEILDAFVVEGLNDTFIVRGAEYEQDKEVWDVANRVMYMHIRCETMHRMKPIVMWPCSE
jgi:hypothetical protein